MSNKRNAAIDDAAEEQSADQGMVRMFKDDFDAMQQEADQLASELASAVSESEKQRTRADEMTAHAQRLQAEFDNYRKRTNETNKRVRQDGAVEVLEKILPVLDAIGQAKTMIKDESTLSGLDIIDRQLGELLSSFNVEQIEALNMPFDPNVHNAVMEEDVPDEQKGTVVKVYQQGYKIGDRVLRHAVVIVGK
ncbi:MAG: nucleotide exchange factor GrpE [Clostridiales bacterium]|nr:nucleotide exchange factor GrpE [Clostridiales bacterium]